MQAISEKVVTNVVREQSLFQQEDQLLLSVISKTTCISADMSCEQTLAIFRNHPDHECVVIVDGLNRPQSLMMRNELFRRLSQRFSADLFSEKPIEKLADQEPLIVDRRESPSHIIEMALSRKGDRLYDCVIVTDGPLVAGILTMSSLLQLSNHLQQKLKEEQQYLIYSSQERIKRIVNEVVNVEHAAKSSGEKSDEMVNFTLEGKTMLQKLTSTLEIISSNVRQQQLQIAELQGSVNDIKKITSIVHELSEQSNLLAINATIEAARAGEHGKAFSVVAQEVMNLAGQTKKSASRISQSVEQIVDVVKNTAEISKEGLQIGLQSDKLITDTESIFLSLFKMVAENKNNLQLIEEQALQANDQANQTVNELKKLNEMNM
ncbi:MAG TPA: hypothetical protein IAA29_14780 [Candidatus Paenibacillus intestinavium]|nr:hypothetical protein [Candidatus Paenibacillus intestinavium]